MQGRGLLFPPPRDPSWRKQDTQVSGTLWGDRGRPGGSALRTRRMPSGTGSRGHVAHHKGAPLASMPRQLASDAMWVLLGQDRRKHQQP